MEDSRCATSKDSKSSDVRQSVIGTFAKQPSATGPHYGSPRHFAGAARSAHKPTSNGTTGNMTS
jgi:hypothetical protein